MKTTRWVVLVAVVLAAGACGAGGGGSKTLADFAEGRWRCSFNDTTDGDLNAQADVQATITKKTDSSGSARLELSYQAEDEEPYEHTFNAKWAVDDQGLRVTMPDFGRYLYRGADLDSEKIEARDLDREAPDNDFRPVQVSRDRSTVTFRWDGYNGESLVLDCARGSSAPDSAGSSTTALTAPPKVEVTEGSLATGSLDCAALSERVNIEADEGDVLLVVLRPSVEVDASLQVWGDIDYLSEIQDANPEATEGGCSVIVAEADDEGAGGEEVALATQAGSGLSFEAGGPDGGLVEYSVISGPTAAAVCDKALDDGLVADRPAVCS